MIKPIHSFKVTAMLPDRIVHLKELAMNFWWCWNSEAKELFVRINRDLWTEVNHNPVMMINRLSQSELEDLATQQDFVSYLDNVYERYQKYMQMPTWINETTDCPENSIAYFSMEYGINESFPNYSGGLGILSGDHLKSSSDLGIPLVGVGLLYQQGYFRQHLTQNGWQTESYNYNDFYTMALEEVFGKDGKELKIYVDIPQIRIWAKVWRVNVGKVKLYLLDTNIPENTIPEIRDLTDQLYGGTRETRIRQEILLGIGGIRMLYALGIEPAVVHINEGHAAFALLERTKYIMKKYSLGFKEAAQISRNSSIFTTHTPVPAGNEEFYIDRMDAYFAAYMNELGINRYDFMHLGQINDDVSKENFSMTVLGLKMTAYHNGVSKLHGAVARNMWQGLWKQFPLEEVPIGHITNGVHTKTWVAREFAELYDRYLSPRWRTEPDNDEVWKKMDTIPTDEIWREKQRRRVRLVLFTREYLQKRQREFIGPEEMTKINDYLDPDSLTIGFARRFATYKRALLLFTDMKRLSKIVNNPEKPVQIIIAGKAHPHDTAGKEVIQQIIQKVRENHLEKKIVFLEDYDMVIARLLVKGCDVWLNNPIRPMEASGTSGMKAAINGTLNLSILDGWWDEAYNGSNGFAIGHGEEYANGEEQDSLEADALYEQLEQVIVPKFYDRVGFNKIPERWIEMMKNSIRTNAGKFSTSRMLKDYTYKYYLPAMKNYYDLISDNGNEARNYYDWQQKLYQNWGSVNIVSAHTEENQNYYVGKNIKIQAEVQLGNLTPGDVEVQIVYGKMNPYNELDEVAMANCKNIGSRDGLYIFEGCYRCQDVGNQGFTVRVVPQNKYMINSTDLYICCWAKA